MTATSPDQVTQLLIEWSNGDPSALERLMPLVHDELRRLAHYYMSRERPDHTLQTTALVNEAYLRLIDYKKIQWQKRTHFFAIAAQVMHRILVEHARANSRVKRGGKIRKVSLDDDEVCVFTEARSDELLALDEALSRLAALDERKGKVVELRFFGGLTNEETAEVLNVSVNTVMRDWSLAQAWLRRELTMQAQSGEGRLSGRHV